ncbi:MAG: fibronectin type III domain-containing protein [Candidatus Lindowbacteria bacterium]|nr:fibronectin type III domain-containing protein [Candidatus Lindowbacteria bacterium]
MGFIPESRIRKFTYFLCSLELAALIFASQIPLATASANTSWIFFLSAQNTYSKITGGATFASSSRIKVDWKKPPFHVDHFHIRASEAESEQSITLKVNRDVSSVEFHELKSSTQYRIRFRACLDKQCSISRPAKNEPVIKTSEEIWQIQGTGDGYRNASKIVKDGNSLPYAIKINHGDQSRTQLYYHPSLRLKNKKIFSIAMAQPSPRENGLSSLSEFKSIERGLLRVCRNEPTGDTECPEGALTIKSFQAIPLGPSNLVRLYFEAHRNDDQSQTTQIYSIDSYDSLKGFDFHPTIDRFTPGGFNSSELLPGGASEPKIEVGTVSEGAIETTGLANARQFKIGYPKRNSSLWDESLGTFMVISGDDACGENLNSLFYSQFTENEWNVKKNKFGCAEPLVKSAHGPVIVHLGQGRYKLYYEDNISKPDFQDPRTEFDESFGHFGYNSKGKRTLERMMNVSTKPFRVIYGDASLNDKVNTMESEDWESENVARDVIFIWPNGKVLNSYEEAGLGDHFIFIPTDNQDLQIMYMNLGGYDNPRWGTGSNGIGMALLVNP